MNITQINAPKITDKEWSGVNIYTEDFFFLPRLKNLGKRFLGKVRGPEAVFRSLIKGLDELGVGNFVNQHSVPKGAIACVLSGVDTLKRIIAQKQAGIFKKIIAGPNIAISPNDFGGILKNEAIDAIIVPSGWVKTHYSSEAPGIADKIRIWPAGVQDYGLLANPNGIMRILFKIGDFNLVDKAYKLGKESGLNPSIIFYGKFKHQDYLKGLKYTKILVYISKSESQGLVLHEAWMANVPTLVLDSGIFEYKGYRLNKNGISAPYLAPPCGMFFKGAADLEDRLKAMLKNYSAFAPRE